MASVSDIIDVIRAERTALRWSYEEAAQRTLENMGDRSKGETHVPANRWESIESGQRGWHSDELVAMCRAVGLEAWELDAALGGDKFQRPEWREYFLAGAQWVASRADCSRRQVGALIVRENRILASGYNGTTPGRKGCLAGGCPRAHSDVPPGSQYDHGPGACIAVHAELSATLWAARCGIEVGGATMYVTHEPCATCKRLCTHAGIAHFVYPDGKK